MLALDKLISEVIGGRALTLVMVRNGQSMGNYAGSIVGWTDSKLSIKGREQANKLFGGFYKHVDRFTGVYSSDVLRSMDTAKLALGFPTRKVITDKRLREINFGDDEGRHFDSLPPAEKDRINSLEYAAPNGESWKQVKERSQEFYRELKQGTHLLFTHGGLICTSTFSLGLQNVISNASVVCLQLDKDKKPEKILFHWQFPQESAEQPL